MVSCNRYPLFQVAGFKQESFNNQAEVLFVVDNSPSMYDDAASLALNFGSFIDGLVDPNAGQGIRTQTLSDAVTNYRNYVLDTGRYLDYQLGLTTTSADPGSSLDKTGNPLPGYNGVLGGDPAIIDLNTPDIAGSFKETLLCQLTDWPAPCGGGVDENCINHDPNYSCGDTAEEVTWEYLACVCGDDWAPPEAGSGMEEGLRSAFLALCRATDLSTADPVLQATCATQMLGTDTTSNAGFLRDDSSVVVVIVSDEGDSSDGLIVTTDEGNVDVFSAGSEDIVPYMNLISLFNRRISFAVVGPYYKDGQDYCNSSRITTFGAQRYINITEETGGFYAFLTAPDGEYTSEDDCIRPPFSEHLTRVGDLLNTMLNVFSLESVPVPDTIRVFVDGSEVTEAECTERCAATTGAKTDATLSPVYGPGWVYEAANNAVLFTGDAVPDYNAEVRIYYKPVDELPRDLPF
jgi:hypothetical protein